MISSLLSIRWISREPLYGKKATRIPFVGRVLFNTPASSALKVFTFLSFLISFSLVSGCSTTPSVVTDYNPKLSYQDLKSYAWYNRKMPLPINPEINNTLFEDRVKDAVNANLQTKGMTISDKPDVQVTFHVTVKRKMEATTTTTGMSYHRPIWPGAVVTETKIQEYAEGSLIIDVLSADGENLLWRGTAKGRVTGHSTPEDRITAINNAVNAILAEFPPKTVITDDRLRQRLQQQGY